VATPFNSFIFHTEVYMPITLTTDNFDAEVLQSDTPVLVDFWATWCGPCKAIAPLLDQASGDYEGRLVIGKLDVDKQMALARQYKVRNIPALLLFKGGEVVQTHVGTLNKSKLDDMVSPHLG